MPKKEKSKRQPKGKLCELPPESKELKVLASEPTYFCRECGRTAATYEDLCKSEPMFNAW